MYLDELSSYNRDSDIAELSTLVNGLITSLVGSETSYPPTTADGSINASWVKKAGQILSRETYPALWEWVKLTGNYVTDTEWLALQDSSDSGRVDCFSSGDDSTTFRMPCVGNLDALYEEVVDIIADNGTYTADDTWTLDREYTEYDKFQVGHHHNGESYNRNPTEIPTPSLSVGDTVIIRSSTSETSVGVNLTLTDNYTLTCSSVTDASLKYIYGIRKAEVVNALPDGIDNIYIFSGNTTTNLPETTEDWLAQQDTNTAAIAETESNLSDFQSVALNFDNILMVKDVKDAGTSGGTPTADSINKRDLNTISINTLGATLDLDNGYVKVEAGVYLVRARCPNIKGGRHRAGLYKVTDDTAILLGATSYANVSYSGAADAVIDDFMTLTEETEFYVGHYLYTADSVGLGVPVGDYDGGDEVYTQLMLAKVGDV